MIITKVELFHVQPRWMFLKISTDEGINGWGEPVLEGRSTVVEEAVTVLSEYLIGQDPFNIEQLWQVMYKGGFYRGGAIMCSAISGIEQALWDIKGKSLGVPVWQLLGGKCRDKIRMYAHITPTMNPSVEELKRCAREKVDKGFTALKTVIDFPIKHIDSMKKVEDYVEKFAAIREVVGKNVDVAIDFHGRVSPAMAKIFCRELEQYYPMFIEEPVLPENIDEMVKISKSTTIPIATGERLFTTWGYNDVINSNAVQVLQPDLCHCGGILQGFKIAAMAENNYASIAPHNPLGPIALAACLQLDTCIPNFTAQEHPTLKNGLDLGKDLFKEAFNIENGYIPIPTKPGLGFEVDEDAVKEYAYDGLWKNSVNYFEDGSFAEW